MTSTVCMCRPQPTAARASSHSHGSNSRRELLQNVLKFGAGSAALAPAMARARSADLARALERTGSDLLSIFPAPSHHAKPLAAISPASRAGRSSAATAAAAGAAANPSAAVASSLSSLDMNDLVWDALEDVVQDVAASKMPNLANSSRRIFALHLAAASTPLCRDAQLAGGILSELATQFTTAVFMRMVMQPIIAANSGSAAAASTAAADAGKPKWMAAVQRAHAAALAALQPQAAAEEPVPAMNLARVSRH